MYNCNWLRLTQNDAKEGYGILQYKNGERYEGQWRANFANGNSPFFMLFGSGVLIYAWSTVCLQCSFLPLGMGTLAYADGDKYVGEWKDGKKSGKGELIYVNGDKFR
jgi:hypothetical protein